MLFFAHHSISNILRGNPFARKRRSRSLGPVTGISDPRVGFSVPDWLDRKRPRNFDLFPLFTNGDYQHTKRLAAP